MTTQEQVRTRQVEYNQQTVSVPDVAYRIGVRGASELVVRRRGAITLRGVLVDPQTGLPTPVYFCEDDPKTPKPNASHPMLPVGPYDGPGGQHGPARWVDYALEHSTGLAHTVTSMALSTMAMPGPVSLRRNYELWSNTLNVSSQVELGQGFPEAQTSVGHHDYYALNKEKDIHRLRINGQSLDELLGGGATDEIMSGQARFWSDFNDSSEGDDGRSGSMAVNFPDGRLLNINAATEARGQKVGMLIWHRAGTPSICLEPTLGVVETEEAEDGLNRFALHLGNGALQGATLDVEAQLINTFPVDC